MRPCARRVGISCWMCWPHLQVVGCLQTFFWSSAEDLRQLKEQRWRTQLRSLFPIIWWWRHKRIVYGTLLFPWACYISFAPPENETMASLNLQPSATKRLQHSLRCACDVLKTTPFVFSCPSSPAPWNQFNYFKVNPFCISRSVCNEVDIRSHALPFLLRFGTHIFRVKYSHEFSNDSFLLIWKVLLLEFALQRSILWFAGPFERDTSSVWHEGHVPAGQADFWWQRFVRHFKCFRRIEMRPKSLCIFREYIEYTIAPLKLQVRWDSDAPQWIVNIFVEWNVTKISTFCLKMCVALQHQLSISLPFPLVSFETCGLENLNLLQIAGWITKHLGVWMWW